MTRGLRFSIQCETRMLRRNLAFAAVAALAQALGLGADSPVSGAGNVQTSAEIPVARPPFSIRQQGDVAWLVRPNGERFRTRWCQSVARGRTPHYAHTFET